jgi:hypothetical protein
MFTRSALGVTQLFTDLRRTVYLDDTSKVPYLSYGFIQGLESVAQRFNQWGCVRAASASFVGARENSTARSGAVRGRLPSAPEGLPVIILTVN